MPDKETWDLACLSLPYWPKDIPDYTLRPEYLTEKDDGHVMCIARRRCNKSWIYQFLWNKNWPQTSVGAQPVPLGNSKFPPGFATHLSHDWSWGFVEIPDVQAYCELCGLDERAFYMTDRFLGDLEFAKRSVEYDFVVSTRGGFYHDMIVHVRDRASPRTRGTAENLRIAIEAYYVYIRGKRNDPNIEYQLGIHADICLLLFQDQNRRRGKGSAPSLPKSVLEFKMFLETFCDEVCMNRPAYYFIYSWITRKWLKRDVSKRIVVVSSSIFANAIKSLLLSPFHILNIDEDNGILFAKDLDDLGRVPVDTCLLINPETCLLNPVRVLTKKVYKCKFKKYYMQGDMPTIEKLLPNSVIIHKSIIDGSAWNSI